jgi:Cd2+/Zn2+-exporting ATPase
VSAHDDDELPIHRPNIFRNRRVLEAAAAGVLVAIALISGWVGAPPIASTILYLTAVAVGAYAFTLEAAEELFKEREVGIDLLMSAAIIGAIALGYYREAALVAFLFSISEALEEFTIQRTRYAIRQLIDLAPQKAHVLRQGAEIELDVEALVIGDRFVVRPGESIPTDGVIQEGSSSIDESAVTGESVPVDRGVGATVFAGTVNGNGALIVEATKTFEDNTLSTIIRLVEEAQGQKAETQKFVDRFARIYSPVVLGVALLVGLAPFVLDLDRMIWLRRAVSLLVAAAPCALAVATPVTIVAAIGSAAKRGVLIKGGQVLELLGRTKAIALDKTGTLTRGRPELKEIVVFDRSEDELLAIAASVEHFSEHPLAHAVVSAAASRTLPLRAATEFRAITASGVEAMVAGRRIAVLKPVSARERVALSEQVIARIAELEASGRTVAVVIDDQTVAGLLAVADTIRPEAAKLVASLRRAGIEHVVMLTGDNEATARAVGREVGIEEIHAGLKPEDKVARVKALREQYGYVAMVGDGINDAPALATASVGIAMGSAGSDAAIAAADVALLGDDLSKIEEAIALGKRSRRVILQNISASMLIVAVLVIATFFADLSMVAAVIGHEGSEVLIIANGLRVAFRRA